MKIQEPNELSSLENFDLEFERKVSDLFFFYTQS